VRFGTVPDSGRLTSEFRSAAARFPVESAWNDSLLTELPSHSTRVQTGGSWQDVLDCEFDAASEPIFRGASSP
jgi:hypothetical protein